MNVPDNVRLGFPEIILPPGVAIATTKTIESPTFHSWFYPHGIHIPSQLVRNKKIRENASEFPAR